MSDGLRPPCASCSSVSAPTATSLLPPFARKEEERMPRQIIFISSLQIGDVVVLGELPASDSTQSGNS
jgi:hypothetical protein